ncbi:GGDEF domain-containing protein [Cognatilysobacter lacus]|uniref:diguanylate cyclase n=1 Tax=Cognatilysobacter lacus TaxID=1643323 RepID=A0A5D8YQ64_9GAMM|nr:GGDEF domain-containing protein [Lysobacter lacus]TZF82424.1 GGDEF domain-containing protein [Lysobacter lacus]
MSRERLRTDFQFAVLVLFCTVALAGVTPFVIYRYVVGDVVLGVIDTAIVAALAGTLLYVWRGGDAAPASLFIVVTTTIGCLVVARMVGMSGALWSYPAIAAGFLLIRRTRALLAASLLILLLALDGGAFPSELARLMYFSSASVTCLLAFVFARHTALQRAQLEALASRDPLTGAANRRAMARELHIAAETARRHRAPVGLLVMDLDHFKRVNDALGHEAGDSVLVDFARLVQSHCRAGDRLFRYGGEEFVLLVPGSDANDLRPLADSLRRAVSAALRSPCGPITVSVGGAVLRADEDNQQWLARADAAMYEAKHQGRDRVVVDG